MPYPLIINEPADKVVAAYRPIIYEIQTTDICWNTKQVSADIYINNVLATTIYTDVPFYNSGGTKKWRLDISMAMQENLKTEMLAVDFFTPSTASDMCKEVYVIFHEWITYFNPYGVPDLIYKSTGTVPMDDALDPGENIGAPPQSDTINVLDATLQHEEVQNLNDYYMNDLFNGTLKFLTHKPDKAKICINDSEFLYILAGTTGTFNMIFYLRAYDRNGVLIGTLGGYGFSFFNTQLLAIPVGPANLNAYSADAIPANTWYYTVQLQTYSGTQFSELRTYFLDKECCGANRVHFKNLLGGIDSASFKVIDKEDFVPAKTSFQKNLPLGFAIKDRGSNTLAASGANELFLVQYVDDRKTALWLSEIATSTDVFMQKTINGTKEYFPYEVKTDRIPLVDPDEDQVTIRFTFKESNGRIAQHN